MYIRGQGNYVPPSAPKYGSVGRQDIYMGADGGWTGLPKAETRKRPWEPGGASQYQKDAFAEAAANNFGRPVTPSVPTVPSPASTSGGGGGRSGGGRRGGGGGGGGGFAAGLSPQVKAAMLALYQKTGANPQLDKFEKDMRAAMDPAKIEAMYGGLLDRNTERYGTARTQAQDASKAGLERMGTIYQELLDRAAQGRTATSQAYQAGDDRLRAIQSRFGAQGASDIGQLNAALAANDAGPISDANRGAMQELFANAQVANERARMADEVAAGDRNLMYAALNSDISSGITQQEQRLLNQIAMQEADRSAQIDFDQAGALRSNDISLQEFLGGIGQQRYGMSKEQAQLALELAKLGIEV